MTPPTSPPASERSAPDQPPPKESPPDETAPAQEGDKPRKKKRRGFFRQAAYDAVAPIRVAAYLSAISKAAFNTLRDNTPRPPDPDADESGASDALDIDSATSPAYIALRCFLWVASGWQISMFEPGMTAFAYIHRSLWIVMAMIWGLALLGRNRPGIVEQAFIGVGVALAIAL